MDKREEQAEAFALMRLPLHRWTFRMRYRFYRRWHSPVMSALIAFDIVWSIGLSIMLGLLISYVIG